MLVGFCPSVAQEHADGILSQLDLLRYVITHVQHSVARELVIEGDGVGVEVVAIGIVGYVGHQFVVADALSVHIELVEAESADEHLGLLHGLSDGEGATHHGRCVCGLGGANPFALPVGGLQESHSPCVHLAPYGGRSVLVPGAHTPVVVGARTQGEAFIGNQNGLGRGLLLRVPHIELCGLCLLQRRCHTNLIGGLSLSALIDANCFVDPTETGHGLVHHGRVGHVLHAEIGDLELGVHRHGKRECRCK